MGMFWSQNLRNYQVRTGFFFVLVLELYFLIMNVSAQGFGIYIYNKTLQKDSEIENVIYFLNKLTNIG